MMLYKTPFLFSNNLYLCTCSYKVPTPLLGAGPICFKILKIFDLIWQEKNELKRIKLIKDLFLFLIVIQSQYSYKIR